MLEKSAKKLVTVVTAGSSLNVPGGNAKVFTWYPGQAGGTALAELLFGEKNFSGHLPLTFYRDISDLPDFEDYSMDNRTYRYFTGKALYPFGYGLSYTSYQVLSASVTDNEVTAEITNNGKMDGDALVQIYVECDSPFAPVHPRLCGFRRISLKAGETGTVSVPLDPLTYTVIDSEGERIPVEHCALYVGVCQPDAQSIELTGSKPVVIRK